jgi:hypothetical protein
MFLWEIRKFWRELWTLRSKLLAVPKCADIFVRDPQILKEPMNYGKILDSTKGDMKQFAYWGPRNIRRYRKKKLIHEGYVATWDCADVVIRRVRKIEKSDG